MPKITFGKYAGTPIDQLPNSYLRWLRASVKIPETWLRIINKKLNSSDYNDQYITISRHAIDMYSKRFLDRWTDRNVGLATHITQVAERAWNEGADNSKRRHQDDGIVKSLEGIKFVFQVSPNIPDYKEVITIME